MPAKTLHAEVARLVDLHEIEIRVNLRDAVAGAETRSDEGPVAGTFAKAGGNPVRNAQSKVIARGNRLVAEET